MDKLNPVMVAVGIILVGFVLGLETLIYITLTLWSMVFAMIGGAALRRDHLQRQRTRARLQQLVLIEKVRR